MKASTSQRNDSEALVPVGYRFPLARPVFDVPSADEVSGFSPQPYGLRFFRSVGSVSEMASVPYRYDPKSQVAVVDDGTGTSLIRVSSSWEKTTTGGADGAQPGVEEWTMDQVGYC